MAHGPLVLGIDLEGINQDLIEHGVNLDVDRVTEIGAVLWDWSLAQPVRIISELINEPDHLSITDEVQQLTGITDEMLDRWGRKGAELTAVLENLAKLIERADYLMAHNAKGYDLPMLRALFARHKVAMPQKLWIDTLTDIEFPSRIQGKSLALLEHSHGFINPFPHRAVTDVLAMLKIASNYDLTRMVKLASSPVVKIVASLKAPNWRNKEDVDAFNRIKHRVSKARFKWDTDSRVWFKDVHKILIDEGKLDYEFEWSIEN
jgi:DNA polymerase-3 subunit epsilon